MFLNVLRFIGPKGGAYFWDQLIVSIHRRFGNLRNDYFGDWSMPFVLRAVPEFELP